MTTGEVGPGALLLVVLFPLGMLLLRPVLPENREETALTAEERNERKAAAKRCKGQLALLAVGITSGILFGLL